MKLIKEMNNKYDKFCKENEDKLIDEFCKDVKKNKIGDMTLGDYAKYSFWVDQSKDMLKEFYEQFKKDTADYDVSFDKFCKFTWAHMDVVADELPDEVKDMVKSITDNGGAEA